MEIILVLLIIYIIFEIPISFGMGIIFKKMNLDFKKGIIPFYNRIILIKKYNLPQYHLILMFIPVVGLYTNFMINKELTKQYQKDFTYLLELTFMPFVFNIFFGLEIKGKAPKEKIDNYFEDQKEMYEKESQQEKTEKQEEKDEYIWFAPKKIKNDTIYKASKNKINAEVKINIKPNDEIIEKKQENKKQKENTITCPKCGTRIPENTEVCFVCGTKI